MWHRTLLTASLKKALLPLLPALPLPPLPLLPLLLVMSWVAVSATVKGSYLQVHTDEIIRTRLHQLGDERLLPFVAAHSMHELCEWTARDFTPFPLTFAHRSRQSAGAQGSLACPACEAPAPAWSAGQRGGAPPRS